MNKDDFAITAENISKLYRIGVIDETQDTFGRVLIDLVKSPIRNYRKYRSLYNFDDVNGDHASDNNSKDILWALRNVSFSVKEGEVLGIIGKNGAGKSTLLKILSRITEPTTGKVIFKGRISSLLEVGTGFHPELTGRENIYLNGTILGMRKKEVDLKIDQIIDFSGVEKFIDTPVKRYSSGMGVRLAFSVAAHLEPEILIIDEVLAVGDAQFQRKCLGKMDNVAKEGRTVVFVSHNMSAINQLCSRVLLLEDGQITLNDRPEKVISHYLMDGKSADSNWNLPLDERDKSEIQIYRVSIVAKNNDMTTTLQYDENFSIEISCDIGSEIEDLVIMCRVSDTYGNILFTSWDTDAVNADCRHRVPGKYISTCKIVGSFLKPGVYLVSVCAFVPKVKIFHSHENILSFEITPIGYRLNPERQGVVAPILDWEIRSHHE